MKISFCAFGIHSYGEWATSTPDNGNDCGQCIVRQERECSVCKKIQVNNINRTIPHDWGKWEKLGEETISRVSTKAIIGYAQKMRRTCNKCGKIELSISETQLRKTL